MLITLKNHIGYCDLIGPENGTAVCLVHSLAADSGMWAEQIPALIEGGYRVLRVDIRGHGGAEAPPGEYNMNMLSSDVAETMNILGIERCHYVGLSIGGMIGQAFALDHAPKLISMTICDAIPASPPNAKELWGPRVEAVKDASSLVPIAHATIERWLSAAFKQAKNDRWNQIYQTILNTDPQGFVGCAAAIADFDFTDRLSSVNTPALVVCGSNDPSAPPEANKRIAALIPNNRYEEIHNALHFPNIEQPAAFNKVLRDWLDTH